MRVLPYLMSAAAVAAVGGAALALSRLAPLPQVSLLYVAPVIASAALWGLGPSLLAAVLSVASTSYFFYRPLYSFSVADPQELLDLVVFVLVAVLTSRLAAGVRSQAIEARELARLQREIAEARLREQGGQLREALLNSVSHDLQTPLASILGAASTLETFGAGGDPAARRELAATIRTEAERLSSYIANVLDLTRIRSGQLAPRLELIELSDIVNAALARKARALAGHRVQVSLPADLPMLRLDGFLMEHAVANVLDNAAKYAPQGTEVRIGARREGGAVVLEVADAGRGLAGEARERLFEPFYRGEAGDRAQAPGTGLGLAICRAFVEANGGSVEAASAGAGRGTTLRIHLPLVEAPGEAGEGRLDE